MSENINEFFRNKNTAIKEIKIFRTVAFLIALFYLLLTIIKIKEVQVQNSLTMRLIISMLYFAVAILSFFSEKIKQNFITILFILGFPLLGSIYYFTAMYNNFDGFKGFACIISTIIYGFIFKNKTLLTLHLLINNIFLFTALYFCKQPAIDVPIFILMTLLSNIVFYGLFILTIDNEKAIIKREQLIKAILSSAPDGFMLLNKQTNTFEYFNLAAKNMLFQSIQKNSQKIEDNHISKFIIQQLPIIKSQLLTKTKFKHELNVKSENNTINWYEITINEVKVPEKPLLIRLQDISEKVIVEKVLHTSRYVLDHASEMIIWINNNGKIVYINEAVCNELGYTYADLLNKPISILYDDTDILNSGSFISELKQKQTIFQEKKVKLKNNSFIDAEIINNYLIFEGEEMNCIFAKDITEKNQFIKTLKENEEQFRSVFEKSPFGMVMIDCDTRKLKKINNSFCNMIGYTADELFNMNVEDYVYEEDRGIEKSLVLKIQNGFNVTSHNTEKRYLKKNGEILWANVSSYLLEDAKNNTKYALATVENISDKKNHQKALENYAKKIEASNKELEQFAYIVSHDLQEPLRMVTNYLQLFSRKYTYKIDTEADEYINFAVGGAKRMKDLIHSILQFSRISSQLCNYEYNAIEDILNIALNNLKFSIEESKAEIIYTNLPKIFCDKLQLVLLFQNLIGNAIKYKSHNKPIIEIKAKNNDNYWAFSIKDNGIGIEKEYFNKIFIIFQRLVPASSSEGTGIGLAICKRIVEHHKGKIWIESEVNIGSTFYFSIPNNLYEYNNTEEV